MLFVFVSVVVGFCVNCRACVLVSLNGLLLCRKRKNAGRTKLLCCGGICYVVAMDLIPVV